VGSRGVGVDTTGWVLEIFGSKDGERKEFSRSVGRTLPNRRVAKRHTAI
jgi:hypothetical protein